jgi:putative ABC transport system permease protein
MLTAWRRLVRAPLFSVGAVATLGLGLGAAVAILQIADAIHLRALPFAEPERLVRLYVTPPARTTQLSLRAETFLALRSLTTGLFEGVVGQRLTTRTMLGPGGAEQVQALGVTEGWASLLGLSPQLGRLFTAAEELAGEESEAVLLADAAWRTNFGADPAILGRRVVLDGITKTVVGVLPRGFAYPYEADFWHPSRADRPSTSPWSFNTPARLRPGVSIESANAALAAMLPQFDAELPQNQRGLLPIAVSLKETLLIGRDGLVSPASWW